MNIIDIALNDFTLVRESSNVYGTKEHGSLKFFVNTNSFFFYKNRVGGTIEFYLKYFWKLEDEDIEIFLQNVTPGKVKTEMYDEPYVQSYKKTYHPYFKSRNISEKTFEQYNLGYESFSDSIVLPVTNSCGNVIGLIRRNVVTNDKNKRYRFTFWENKPPLWQMHHLNGVNPQTKILLFEGCWSAMLWQQTLNPIDNNVQTFALMGAFISKQLVELLNGLNIYYIADNDDAGLNVIEQLKSNGMIFKTIIPEVYPDDLTEAQIKYCYVKKIRGKS